MKKNKFRIITCLFLSFYILAALSFPILFNFLDISRGSYIIDNESTDVFISSVNGKDYLAKRYTAEDIENIKKELNMQSSIETWPKSDSNIIIDGHGTGFTVSSSEDLESLIGKVSLLNAIPESGQKYQATADLSSEIYFPAVGDQGGQGSCSAWANAYYAYGYLEAKDY